MSEIIFSGTGAVTEVNFCPECSPRATHDTDHHCLYTQDDQYIQSQEVKYFEDFEEDGTKTRWTNDKHHKNQATGETMLGKYKWGDASPYETFYVNRRADGIIFELDFYEIGIWETDDKAEVFVDAEKIDLGAIHSTNDESHIDGTSSIGRTRSSDSSSSDEDSDDGHNEGTTNIGITWERDIIGNITLLSNSTTSREADHYVRHHIKLIVPESCGLYGDGKLRLKLKSNFKPYGSSERAIGWDNVKVTVIRKCHTDTKSIQIPVSVPTQRGPTIAPSGPSTPSAVPSNMPSFEFPTEPSPSRSPTRSPTRSLLTGDDDDDGRSPTQYPTRDPTKYPTRSPARPSSSSDDNAEGRIQTRSPTRSPSSRPPTRPPTRSPTGDDDDDDDMGRPPTRSPTRFPT